jgi:hypothetical protein
MSPHIRHGSSWGPWCGGAFVVIAARQSCNAFCFEEERDRDGAEGVAFGLEGRTEVVEREVWLAEGNDVVAYQGALGGAVRSLLREDAEGALGMVAERVAQDTKTAGRRAKASGHRLGGEALNAVGA